MKPLSSILCLVLAGCLHVNAKDSQFSRADARKISDGLATTELRGQEAIHKRDDPNVELRLKDYKVSESEDVKSYDTNHA